MRLSDFKVLSFDCYGTLIDWETGLVNALAPLARRAGAAPGEKALADFADLESRLQSEHPDWPYPDVLEAVHGHLSQRWGVAVDDREAAAFGRSVGDWPAFADTPGALSYLAGHFKLVILSNVDRASFALSNRRLGVTFDHVFTAEEIGSWKPDLGNFRYMLDRLEPEGVGRNDIVHVAQSLFHDHEPANRIGLASAWIDRRADRGAGGGATPRAQARWDFRFSTLEQLAQAHRAEQSAG